MRTNEKMLVINPLKNSQPLGAVIAFLGIDRAIPLMHGCQGCTAFAKSLLERHFREPVYPKTTAITEVEAIMGGGKSIIRGIEKVIKQNNPKMIGLISTGLTEVKGDDFCGTLNGLKKAASKFEDITIIPVSTPDYAGSLQQGYASATRSLIENLVQETPEIDNKQINLLPGSFLKPADIWELKDTVSAFDLKSIVLPDISGSLGGQLEEEQNFIASGGTPLSEINRMGTSIATFSLGESMQRPGMVLNKKTGIDHFHFESLFGLEDYDRFLLALSKISGLPVPARFRRERKQLQDAMLDCHFFIGKKKFALALEPDLLWNYSRLILEMGGEVTLAISPLESRLLESTGEFQVMIGDLNDLELHGEEAEMIISNSNATYAAEKLDVPLMRAGFPILDRLGINQQPSIGYRGSMNLLFELSNYFLNEHQMRKNNENSFCY